MSLNARRKVKSHQNSVLSLTRRWNRLPATSAGVSSVDWRLVGRSVKFLEGKLFALGDA
jgi:hypothetical protein